MALNFPSNPSENDVYQFGLLTYIFKNGKWVSQSRGASQLPWYSNMEQARALWKRLAAEAGLNLVDGSFEEGAVLTGSDDVIWWQAGAAIYGWHLDAAKTVAAGSTPTNIGTDWVDRTDVVLRNELNNQYSFIKGNIESNASSTLTLIQASIDAGIPVYLENGKTIYVDGPIVIKTGTVILGGKNTELKMAAGSNADVFVTENFASLTGVGPLVNAPMDFKIAGFRVNGNYLADWVGSTVDVDTTYNNTSGYGFKIFGSKYHIDVELVNCAEVGFYTEAVDYTSYGQEQDCTVRLRGRVFGKEAFINRGPADINIEHVMLGCAGWKATASERNAAIVTSTVYSGEPVDVMVSDEVSPYNGHHEFGFMHLYGNLNGLGYRTRNTGRLKGQHMVCENCRGGAYFDSRVWGGISMLECHSNGREPSTLAGTLSTYPDIDNQSLQGFNLKSVVRRSETQAASYLALNQAGRGGKVELDYFTIDSTPLTTAKVANITSENSDISIRCQSVGADAVYLAGVANKLSLVAKDVTANAVYRYAGASSENRGNEINIVAYDCTNLLYLDGAVTTESIKITGELSTGQTVTAGTALDLYNRGASVDIAVRVGSTYVSSYDNGRSNLDNTVTTAQTITVTHNYFQTPDPSQVSFNIYDTSPVYGGALGYCYLQSVSATKLVFAYKLSAIGTNGPLVLCWKIS